METFGRASFSLNGFGKVVNRPTVGPVLGQNLGQTLGPTQKQVVQRIQATQNRYSDIFNRNAEIPLEYRVTGDFQHQVNNTADEIWRNWVQPFVDRPSAPYWNEAAPSQMISDADNFDRQVAELDRQVKAAELKAGGMTSPPTVPSSGGISQAGMTTSGALLMGAIALGSLVGAILLGQGDGGFMLAGKNRR